MPDTAQSRDLLIDVDAGRGQRQAAKPLVGEGLGGELVVRALRLLQRQHVRPVPAEPFEHDRQPHADRDDVERGQRRAPRLQFIQDVVE